MYDVQGRWALITGAARGIGYLSAKFMAEQGCNLILHSRDLAHTDFINYLKDNNIISDYSWTFKFHSKQEGRLIMAKNYSVSVDIVMNNAGLQIAYRTEWCGTPAEDYEVSFRVNTIAPAMICYHFLPKMMKKGTGRILNTTSGIALDVCQAGYSASKAALDKITIDMGSKVEGTDVLINLTDPGWCRTDLGGAQAPNAPESAIPGITVGVFVNDGKSGRYLGAQNFAGMTLEDAVKKAEAEFDSPYGK